MRIPRTLTVVSAAACLALAAASPALAGQPAAKPAAMPQPAMATKANILFSVLSSSATVKQGPSGTMMLSVPASSTTVWFSDRPSRLAGTGTLSGLVSNWNAYGFKADPPNAVLVTSSSGKSVQRPVTLTNPTTAGGMTTFTVKPLDQGMKVMGMTSTGQMPTAGTFGESEIFIDDAYFIQCGPWGSAYWVSYPYTVNASDYDGSGNYSGPAFSGLDKRGFKVVMDSNGASHITCT